ncbi:MAG: thioredoxin [Deltaproteobacteria bacterium HGW-Deltaproteobacteria-14]|jgi:thioredoxin-like negative regulator of GroEL|nr:MAG: thioredoxin [Deltaproteobacteria bacterium HGW-Deltaproteobacteria-14]
MSLTPVMTEEALDERVASGDLLVAYFSTPTCNVCKVLRPKVADLLDRIGVGGVYVDTTAVPATAAQRLVFAVPTIIVYGDRRELERYGRHLTLDALEATLTRYAELLAGD